jgi:hypothetical protein
MVGIVFIAILFVIFIGCIPKLPWLTVEDGKKETLPQPFLYNVNAIVGILLRMLHSPPWFLSKSEGKLPSAMRL